MTAPSANVLDRLELIHHQLGKAINAAKRSAAFYNSERPPYPTGTCPRCGREFPMRQPSKKWCSPSCRNAASLERNRT